MPGLRERKRRKTFAAIHEAALRLFAERGYSAVTIADIAEAADVSRATVFAYYPAKEDIVLGDTPLVLELLRSTLAEAAGRKPVVEVVRDWLSTLTGWMEPDVLLQRRLAHEVPAVDAARSRMIRGSRRSSPTRWPARWAPTGDWHRGSSRRPSLRRSSRSKTRPPNACAPS